MTDFEVPRNLHVPKNLLFYGDNLQVLRRYVADETIDLVYLDPPSYSKRVHNVLFKPKAGTASHEEIEAFDNARTWTQESISTFEHLTENAPTAVASAIDAARRLVGESDMLAYLVMITARLVELRRALKASGSLYLHCDPTTSHYLRIMLDAVFGPSNFKSEIVWRRKGTLNNSKSFEAVHDVLLYYGKNPNPTFNTLYLARTPEYVSQNFRFTEADGRRWSPQSLSSPISRPSLTYAFTAKNGQTYHPPPNGWKYTLDRMRQLDDAGRLHYPAKASGRLQLKRYLDEVRGEPIQDVWTDVPAVRRTDAEWLGYPTQKPLTLLERIIASSSNPGDVVLDPCCGSGATVVAAQRLGRRWIGIDISVLSIDLIKNRLREAFGSEVAQTYEIDGTPRDVEGARALFAANPAEFERWAVSLVSGMPGEEQIGDWAFDGIIHFPLDRENVGRTIVAVNIGGSHNPDIIRHIVAAIDAQKAELGVVIVMDNVMKELRDAAEHSGIYHHPLTGRHYPKVQIISVLELLRGDGVNMPTPVFPHLRTSRHEGGNQPSLLD